LLGQPERNLTFPNKIAFNGRSFLIKSLVDTRVNGFIFINIRLVRLLIKNLGLRIVRLSKECPITRFDGKPADPITYAVVLSMITDRRVQHRVLMLVADLGQHDMIIGRMWFEKYSVLLDCKGRRMIWPDKPTLFESVAYRIPTPLPISILKRKMLIDPAHQSDANRRDQLL
jgi:predicted aspartyl protease